MPRVVGARIDEFWPSWVRAAAISVKIVFQVTDRMIWPGAAFSAPVGGVYVP
jgi:hypothetical protein